MTNTLSTGLKSRIIEHHTKAQAAAKTAIAHALEAGKLLAKAKEDCTHGNWRPFLESLEISPRTAQRYMRLAKNEHVLKSDSMSHLSMTQSLELLSSKKSVKIVGGPSLIDFGISGLSENTQLSTIPPDGSFVFITPSSKDPGFYFVEKLGPDNFRIAGWKRPILEDAVICCLDILGVPRSLWKAEKKMTDEPLFMDMSRKDIGYETVLEMGLVPNTELFA